MALHILARILALTALAASLKFDKEKPETAIEKVLRVLRTLRQESVDEGVQEAADFKKFFKFCDVTENEKIYRIDKSGKKIDRFTADSNLLKSQISELDTSINKLDEKISDLNAKIEKTEDDRAAEVAKYNDAAAEIDNAISTLNRAIQTLLSSQENMEGKVGLSQLESMTKDVGHLLDNSEQSSLLQMTESQVQALISLQSKPGQAPGYTFKSGDIIATLKGLLTTFKTNKQTLDISESENKMTYDTLMTNLKSQLKFASEAHEEKDMEHDEKVATKADTDQNNQDEKDDKKADEGFLAALQKDCDDKDKLSKRRKEKREEEISLLDTAIKKTEAIPGSRPSKGAKSFVQQAAPAEPALVFLQMHADRSDEIEQGTVDMLKAKAAKLGSDALSLAAMSVQRIQEVSGTDPFVQIRKVFNTLIDKLHAQAENDKSNKEWCDAEILKNTGKRDAAQIKIEELHGELAKQGSNKDKLLSEIADLNFEINKSTVELAEATELREDEHAKNTYAIKANSEAAAAVKNSLDFYNPSLLQTDDEPVDIDARDKHGKNLQDYAPKVAQDEYAGSKNSGGVIGILQKVWSDFTRAVSEITRDEEDAAADYKEYKKTTEDDIAQMEKSVETKEGEVAGLSSSIGELNDQEADEQDKLKLAKDELDKLHGMCIVPAMSYEEKRAKRQKEIDGLKEASDYLEDLIQEKKAEE